MDTETFPVNRLYYELKERCEREISRHEFCRELTNDLDEEESRDRGVKNKCLYPFCRRESFRLGNLK